ncbi:hypothetical protein GALMADRAFT_225770 [Galerina marginata CBS 339.88]|uniref:CxC6 like cysteine cluster associated with KDZ domain-containing protein n=1 Tax=Galerina marginata (strain CBS 339.88) TaxID=685588 RepID=A0A067TAN7_GALM3|nr:hypothetical protein GALMADRAFT_225770 [Galerina marginata CBS 339.88]
MNVDPDSTVQMKDVTMEILDGIVMGPMMCAADDCTGELKHHRGGVFCEYHEHQYGAKCRMRDCLNDKINPTQACEEHQPQWRAHVQNHSRINLSGIKRMLQRPDEIEEWQSAVRGTGVQAHDEEPRPKKDQSHFFSPARFYCVETICKPCGVVVAWTKFAKAESETNVLKFLETVHPTPETRPQYICIDKACRVLRTSIANGSWLQWQITSRFIVDSYYYINHRLKDILCRTWCNPAPLNGSAPNLVILEEDKNGVPQYKRAFNTNACEHLNSWLGGYDSILKRMTISNFNWYLNTMLFLHTKRVLEKAGRKGSNDDEHGDMEDEE